MVGDLGCTWRQIDDLFAERGEIELDVSGIPFELVAMEPSPTCVCKGIIPYRKVSKAFNYIALSLTWCLLVRIYYPFPWIRT